MSTGTYFSPLQALAVVYVLMCVYMLVCGCLWVSVVSGCYVCVLLTNLDVLLFLCSWTLFLPPLYLVPARLSGIVVTETLPSPRVRPAPEQQLARKGKQGKDGRELRVVVNTNDPDYEHFYSIESYDEPMAMEQSIHLTPTANQSHAPADPCVLPLEEGNCWRFTLRWYFNSQVQACRPFIYSGCEGNANRFLQQETCEERCLGEVTGAIPLKKGR
ncbi:papilin-like isoform X2 [Oncorhynchus nerka]|uniref:papilin-like isoform X2 n=1 Tax=Oncorhynchus nerka TaxID=8023 RepID=UPI0031B85579